MSEEKHKLDINQLIKALQNLKFYGSAYFPCNGFRVFEGRTFDDVELDYKIKYWYKKKSPNIKVYLKEEI